LSALVGASREHVTRSLQQLADDGLVRVERQRYRVRKPLRAAIPATYASEDEPNVAGEVRRAPENVSGSAMQLGLPKRAATELMRGASLASYDAGEPIRATSSLHVTCLVQGAARVMLQAPDVPATVWLAKPWQFIGVGAADPVAAQRRAFRAVALGPSIVATFDAPLLSRMLGMLSADELFRFLGYCHAALSRQLYVRCRMLGLSHAERLLYQLHLLSRDFPEPARGGTAIALPDGGLRRELAQLIGIEAGPLSRALNALARAERIRVEDDGRIVVLHTPR
jgi:CRP-like cAMP-binding protein